MKKKGFTLVELSIVIIIIGLLTGGILAGRSLIKAVNIQIYVSKLNEYNTAYTSFKTVYKNPPGDSEAFTPPGDGDLKSLETGFSGLYCMSSNNRTVPGSYSGEETNQVWAHLSQAEMLEKKYLPFQPSGCSGGSHSIESGADISFPAFTTDKVAISANGTGWPASTNGKYPLMVRSIAYGSSGYSFHSSLKANDTVAVDKKMDDGLGYSGKFFSESNNGTDPCENVASDPTMACVFWWYPRPDSY